MDLAGGRAEAEAAQPAPQTAGDQHHTPDREPRDLVTANKEQPGDNLLTKALRWTWLSSQRVSKLIRKTKISSAKAVDSSHITANTTRDRRTGKSSYLVSSLTSATSLSSSKHPPCSGCIAKMVWRELMCANSCVIVCSGSQAPRDHSNTPM